MLHAPRKVGGMLRTAERQPGGANHNADWFRYVLS